jgi:hypothetical protein
VHHEIAGPLAHAFSTSFIWALVMVAVAIAPAFTMAIMARAGRAPVGRAETVVLAD